jgi:Trp operon repressor
MAQALGVEYSDLMKLAGYIEEKHEEDKIFELVFKDDETGEVVDVVRGVKEMFRKDATWANVAYRVSHELSDDDRRVLTEMTLSYLKSKRALQKKGDT